MNRSPASALIRDLLLMLAFLTGTAADAGVLMPLDTAPTSSFLQATAGSVDPIVGAGLLILIIGAAACARGGARGRRSSSQT